MDNIRLALCLTITLMLGITGCVSKINGVDIGKGSGSIERFMKSPTLRSHADRGNPHAQNNLGNMFRHGGGTVAFNELEAVRYLSLAARQGNPAALHNLGLMAATGKDTPSGSSHAQYSLGLIHLFGQGVTKDTRKGIKWLLFAAEQNDERAQYEVGKYLLLNEVAHLRGMWPSDFHEKPPKARAYALSAIRRAAENGHPKAQSFLGKTLLESRKYLEAAKWLEVAARQGDADARASLQNSEIQTTLKDAREQKRRLEVIEKRAARQRLKERARLDEQERRAKRLADAKLRDQKRKEAAIEVWRLNTTALDYLTKASRYLEAKDIALAVWHAMRCVNDWEELTTRFPREYLNRRI